ncbi:TonB-dependent receptor plug domain-containing protein [Desulfovibrio inopinatus]|uniref:TonB-dependent receptor plug domain-containing protein n=1 Tax=Desulfovibrio inopinatus TaxID=102109 RepID=UPI0003FC9B60|nr:TonB-dependent receptor [Desulfovibrio inopinatus]
MRLFSVALIALLVLPVLSFAAERGDTPQTLPEMVVTGISEPAPKKELPVHVQVIDRDEIDHLGVDTLDELITKQIPGTAIKYPGAYTSMRVRGFETYKSPGANIDAKTLVLVDGNPLGSGNLSIIPLDNVERVEVMRGPGSVLYGASAMGGVINIITKRGKGDVSGKVSMEYGSFNHVQPRGSIQGSVADGAIGYSLAGRVTSDEQYDMGDGDRYDNTAYHDGAASGTLTISPSENHTFHILGNYFNAWNVGNPGPTYSPTRVANIDDTMKYLSMVYEGEAPSWDVNWRLAAWGGEHYYADNDTPYYQKSEIVTDQFGFDGRITVPTFSFGRFTLGGRWMSIYEKRDGDGVYAPNSSYDSWSIYGEEKITVGDFTFIGGARFDQYFLGIHSNDLISDVSSQNKTMEHISWRAGVNWQTTDWLALRLSAGSAFTPPDAYKFSGRYQMGTVSYVGNAGLKPEQSTTFEGGFNIDYKGLQLDGTLFHTLYYDAITSTSVPGSSPWQTWTNSDGWRLTGVEGFLSYTHPFEIKDHTLSVTPYINGIWYLERREEDTSIEQARGTDTILNLSEYSFTPGLQLDFDSLVSLDVNGQWQGPQKVVEWNYSSPRYGRAKDKDPFFILNARLTVNPLDCLSAYVKVDNITDEQYSYVDGYPMPGRTFAVGLEYTF